MVKKWELAAGLFAAWCLLAESTAAQEAPGSLEELVASEKLHEGDGLYVTVRTGRRIKADLSDLSSESLSMRTRVLWTNRWETLRFAEDDIVKIERQDSLWNGFHIGFWAALGVSALFGADFDRPEAALLHLGAVGGGAGLAGAILDATIQETVYEAFASRAGGGLSEALNARQLGAQISLEW